MVINKSSMFIHIWLFVFDLISLEQDSSVSSNIFLRAAIEILVVMAPG